MHKYKEVVCSKCLGELLAPVADKSEYFYCNSCAWAKFGGVLGNPNTAPDGGSDDER
jgi:hypothetical protein